MLTVATAEDIISHYSLLYFQDYALTRPILKLKLPTLPLKIQFSEETKLSRFIRKMELDFIRYIVFCSISVKRSESMKLAGLQCCQLWDFVTRFGDSLAPLNNKKKELSDKSSNFEQMLITVLNMVWLSSLHHSCWLYELSEQVHATHH